MKSHASILAGVVVALAGSVALAGAAGQPTIYTPTSIKWSQGAGALKGVMVAALDGDWSKAGAWTIRLDIPDGVKFPAHYHPDTERATVISGTFLVGVGSTFDATKLTALPAGSFAVIPAGVWHYAMTKGETILQLSGTAPFAMETDQKPGM